MQLVKHYLLKCFISFHTSFSFNFEYKNLRIFLSGVTLLFELFSLFCPLLMLSPKMFHFIFIQVSLFRPLLMLFSHVIYLV